MFSRAAGKLNSLTDDIFVGMLPALFSKPFNEEKPLCATAPRRREDSLIPVDSEFRRNVERQVARLPLYLNNSCKHDR